MCFSAPISFTASAVLTTIGVVTVKNTKYKKEYVLALFPLIFALQQFLEGISWLYLTGYIETEKPYILAYLFNFCAQVLWPLLAPLGVYLIEPSKLRKSTMLPIVIGGVACSLYLFYCITLGHIISFEQGHHIVYETRGIYIYPYIDYIYLFIVSAAFLISTHRLMILFGLSIIASFIITDAVAYQAYISVWCFFAAVLSLILFAHFWKLNTGKSINGNK